MHILFVVTEHRSFLDARRRGRYAETARQLESLAGAAPAVAHYTEADSLGPADAIVISGSDAPWAAHDRRELDRLLAVVSARRRPTFGICAGMQLLVECVGGEVAHGDEPERGFLPIDVLDDADLLRGLPARATVYQSHTDEVTALPDGFRVLAASPSCRVQAIADETRGLWGTQFHPEHSTDEHPAGSLVLRNFVEIARRALDG